jgi:hypothetical protein
MRRQQVALVDLPEEPSLSYDLRPLAGAIDVEVMAARLAEVILREVFSHVIDPEILRPVLTEAMAEELAYLSDLLAANITLRDISAPAAVAFAEEVGRQGLSDQNLERSYRVGIEALWDSWMNVVDEHSRRTGDSVVDVVRASIPLFFGVVDRMLLVSLDAYQRAASARRQTREHRRRRLVDQMLDGTLVTPGADAERFIGYRFAHHHLAGVLDAGDRAEDKKLADELKRVSHAADWLVLERDGRPTELWLGLRAALSGATRAALATRVASSGRRIAFGDVAAGLEGFRSSMWSARDAAAIQAMLGDDVPQVLWADDVRIETLALANPDGARAMVSSELGTVLERGLLTRRVRETLEAWLATGSYVGAAARLGVHEQTVRQRLHRLEEALGRSLHSRRTELHVALRLSLLSDQMISKPPSTGRSTPVI